jgi:hypothetical protein
MRIKKSLAILHCYIIHMYYVGLRIKLLNAQKINFDSFAYVQIFN